jgi:mannose-6-phosphate isomerase-like protein (cupin superfamily)
MHVRRVVTGHDANERSVFVSDEQVAPITTALMPGTEFHRLWGSDDTVRLPTDGSPPSAPLYFPPVGGFRFGVFTLAPDSVTLPSDLDIGAAINDFQSKLPGLMEKTEPENPGMHTTDTVDFDFVLSGEVWLELDDGAEVHLTPGDCVVQNGTRHAWRNRTATPTVIAVAIVGAARTGG